MDKRARSESLFCGAERVLRLAERVEITVKGRFFMLFHARFSLKNLKCDFGQKIKIYARNR